MQRLLDIDAAQMRVSQEGMINNRGATFFVQTGIAAKKDETKPDSSGVYNASA